MSGAGRRAPGARASGRLAPELAPGAFRPEERTLEAHLALLAAVARLVRFPDPVDPEADGTWARLFEQEPAVAMAEILAFPAEARRDAFAGALEAAPAAAARALAALAGTVEAWLGRFAAAGERRFAALLDGAEGRVAPRTLLRSVLDGPAEPAALLARLAPAAEGEPVARAKAARQALLEAHEGLIGIVALMAAQARPLLAARLACGEIDPALGLIVAELKLLAEVEEALNRFGDRHCAYYYGRVLGQAPRPARPESLLLRIAPGGRSAAVPEGARLLARSGPDAQAFRALDGLRVAEVEVAEALSLRYERSPLISPQSEMGFVTGVRAARLRLDRSEGSPRLFTPEDAPDRGLGLRIASPMLFLAEGRRRVEVRLGLVRRQEGGPPAGGGAGEAAALAADPELGHALGLGPPDAAAAALAPALAALPPEAAGLGPRARLHWAALALAATPAAVAAVFGRLVTAALIEGEPWPDGAFRALLAARAALLGPEGAAVVGRILGRPRPEAFQAGLNDAFVLTLTSAEGPLRPKAARVAPLPEGAGIAFAFALDETAPAVTAAPGAAAPVLEILTAPEARFCPVSLFEPFALERVTIAVEVEGLARLAAFSDDGPVETSQPFLPFGARPKDGAVLLVGAPELGRKPVTRIGARLVWADLPRTGGGFAEYYRAYGPAFAPPAPGLGLAYLTGEGWKRLGAGPVPMVTQPAPDAPLAAERRLEAEVPGRPEPARSGAAEDDFRHRQRIRSGLLALTLVCPGDGFGHAAYPAALAHAMRPRLVPQLERPIPPLPWTPQLAEIALDYRAEAAMALDAPAAARPGERVEQVGAFGAQEIFPARTRPGAGLFPRRLADGALFVRLAGPGATGPLSLAFEMAAASHRRTAFAPEPVAWHYLAATGWTALPAASLIADTTEGLMRSGLVALDLPEDAVLLSSEMPGEGAWIAAAARGELDAYPRLAALATNGLRAEALEPPPPGAGAPRVWSLDPPLPGIGRIEAMGPPAGGAPAEDEAGFRARVAERLRHRQRLVTGWDAERLVLGAFPEVGRARAFPLLDRAGAPGRAGALTVVVVPEAPADAVEDPARARMFDMLVLRRIEAHLAARAAPGLAIAVRNPSYERLQVRAKVGFRAAGDEGTLARRLKRDLARALSVWTAEGALAGFGWQLNLSDVGALIAELPYVDFLTDFSILHLVADDLGRYRLHDTARATAGAAGRLAAAEPWSLALPMRDHWITPARERRAEAAHAAGIGRLGIGETLIVDGGGGG